MDPFHTKWESQTHNTSWWVSTCQLFLVLLRDCRNVACVFHDYFIFCGINRQNFRILRFPRWAMNWWTWINRVQIFQDKFRKLFNSIVKLYRSYMYRAVHLGYASTVFSCMLVIIAAKLKNNSRIFFGIVKDNEFYLMYSENLY